MKLIFHGGDNMFGRAVQLTLPVQTHGADVLTDTAKAIDYLYWALGTTDVKEISDIRKANITGSYLWGDITKIDIKGDVRIINAETSFTSTIQHPDPNKALHYHTNINNVEHLVTPFAEPIVFCLANNHTMDFKPLELDYWCNHNYCGIGHNLEKATKPAIINIGNKRLLIFSFAAGCSGVPSNWAASNISAGIAYLLPIVNKEAVNTNFLIINSAISKYSHDNDVIVLSIHWGPNWATDNDGAQYRQALAHRLIDANKVDVIYGHSSHHIRGIELYKNKLIMYGAGDFINDYEGIENHGEYNRDGMLLVVSIDNNGNLVDLDIYPTFIHHLQVKFISDPERRNKLIRDINKWSKKDASIKGKPLLLQLINIS